MVANRAHNKSDVNYHMHVCKCTYKLMHKILFIYLIDLLIQYSSSYYVQITKSKNIAGRSNIGNQLHMFRFSLKKQGNEAGIQRRWMSPSSSKQNPVRQ